MLRKTPPFKVKLLLIMGDGYHAPIEGHPFSVADPVLDGERSYGMAYFSGPCWCGFRPDLGERVGGEAA